MVIQTSFSPCRRAASTKSWTTTFIDTARLSRKTRVLSSTAMIRIRLMMDEPKMSSRTRAKMSCGMAMRMSTARASSWSTQPPITAAVSPRNPPMVKERAVVSTAILMVLRAP